MLRTFGKQLIKNSLQIRRKSVISKITNSEESIKLYFRNRTKIILKMTFGIIGLTGFGFWYKYDYFKNFIANETADITSKTLSKDEIKDNATQFTKDVLSTVTSDSKIQNELNTLVIKLLYDALQNEKVINQLLELLVWACSTDEFCKATIELLYWLYENDDFIKNTQIFVNNVLNDETVQETVSNVFKDATIDTISNKDVQQTTSDAIWLVLKNMIYKKSD